MSERNWYKVQSVETYRGVWGTNKREGFSSLPAPSETTMGRSESIRALIDSAKRVSKV